MLRQLRMAFALPLLCILSCVSNSSAQNYSLVIGVDGLGSYGLYTANTPNLDSLINGTFGGGAYNGALAQNAFAGGVIGTSTQQATVSGPGWSSILTGVWVDQHNVNNNSFTSPDYSNNPTYLETLEENVAGIYSASAVTWSPIDTHIISTVNDGNSSMDFRATGSDASNATTAANQLAGFAANSQAAMFVHLDDVDIAGHVSGPYSNNYLNEINQVDFQIGQMLSAIQNRANFADENWQIIITSDHGHRPGGGHGGQTPLERSAPALVVSKYGAQGFIPSNAGHAPSMVDIAPTVLNHFGLAQQSNYAGQAIGGTVNNYSTDSLINNGLVAHLNFDGNTNSTHAGSGGSVVGNVNFVEGKFGQAVAVDQFGDGHVELNDDFGAMFGNNTDFTISMWVKFDSFTSDPAILSNKDWASGNNTGINVALNSNNTLDLNTKANSGARSDIEPLSLLKPGDWQNLVITVDRNGSTLLYMDGFLVGNTDTSIGSFASGLNWVLLNDATGNYGFGSSTSGLMIDEFSVWSRILTFDEITTLSMRSLSTVPEPSSVSLLAIGLVAGLLRRRR